MRPHASVWKFVVSLIVMAMGAAIAIPLARYAERDDAPGGVLIALLIFAGAVGLAWWIGNQRPDASAEE